MLMFKCYMRNMRIVIVQFDFWTQRRLGSPEEKQDSPNNETLILDFTLVFMAC